MGIPFYHLSVFLGFHLEYNYIFLRTLVLSLSLPSVSNGISVWWNLLMKHVPGCFTFQTRLWARHWVFYRIKRSSAHSERGRAVRNANGRNLQSGPTVTTPRTPPVTHQTGPSEDCASIISKKSGTPHFEWNNIWPVNHNVYQRFWVEIDINRWTYLQDYWSFFKVH